MTDLMKGLVEHFEFKESEQLQFELLRQMTKLCLEQLYTVNESLKELCKEAEEKEERFAGCKLTPFLHLVASEEETKTLSFQVVDIAGYWSNDIEYVFRKSLPKDSKLLNVGDSIYDAIYTYLEEKYDWKF